jgi:hypothetical protein
VDDCFIGGGIDRSNCLLEAAAENYRLSIKSVIDAKSVLLSVLINPEKDYLNVLHYIDVVSLNRFFGPDLNLICRGIADKASQFPWESNLALKHLGLHVLQMNKDFSPVIKQCLQEMAVSGQSAKNLFQKRFV